LNRSARIRDARFGANGMIRALTDSNPPATAKSYNEEVVLSEQIRQRATRGGFKFPTGDGSTFRSRAPETIAAREWVLARPLQLAAKRKIVFSSNPEAG
jgi:hypothetical protein